ncbi:MAG: aldose 1-epimerase [Chitinophagaceae bacterium]|jgi:aldose 1-epimerase|nr:aldose 1-epimerase [Chitinophagaceae bacterium]
MRFTIEHRIQNDLQLIALCDKLQKTEAVVLPAYGALLHEFSFPLSSGLFNVIDNYAGADDIKKDLRVSHKGPKLSPFVCRIKNGKYHFDNKEYEFQKKFLDGSAIHGLLVDKAFDIIEEAATDTSACVIVQRQYHADDAAYPFHFTCTVKYELSENAFLKVETQVENQSEVSIPVVDGWHPYFTLDGKVNDWEMFFNAPEMLEFDDELIPTGRLIANKNFLKPEKIGDTFLDNCFVLENKNNEAIATLSNAANGLRLSLFAIKNYPYLQIYTPPHRNSIAIENLSGAPDCFNNGMGLTVLEPHKSKRFVMAVQVERV